MTSKEIMYVDDALAHAQFLSKQCRDAANQLKDPQLRQQAAGLAETHCQLYTRFYNLI